MFSDPFTAVMALILLAFIGTLAVFLRIWRELDSLRAILADIRDSLQLYAVDAAQQNRELASIVRDLRVVTGTHQASTQADTCLGELLERGIPNLPQEQPGQEEAELVSVQRADAELFRHLEGRYGREKS